MDSETPDSATPTGANGVNGQQNEDVQMNEGGTPQPTEQEPSLAPQSTEPATNGTIEPAPTPATPATSSADAGQTSTLPPSQVPGLQAQTTQTPPAQPHTPSPAVPSFPMKDAAPSPAGASTPLGLAIPAAHDHGSPTRVYMNTKVGPVLLEGMKWVAKHEPEKPLKWLSDFLAARSKEIEGE